MVMTLNAVPTRRLVVLEAKSDPCPQSCWRMNSRTARPDVGSASSRVSQYPMPKLHHIASHNVTNSETVAVNWNTLAAKWEPRYSDSKVFRPGVVETSTLSANGGADWNFKLEAPFMNHRRVKGVLRICALSARASSIVRGTAAQGQFDHRVCWPHPSSFAGESASFRPFVFSPALAAA